MCPRVRGWILLRSACLGATPTLDYTVQIFKAAERFGFRQLLIGMGFNNHVLEAWTLATATLALTSQAMAMVAVRPGFYSAPVLAKMVVTLDLISNGRLSLNMVTGGRPEEQAMYGDYALTTTQSLSLVGQILVSAS